MCNLYNNDAGLLKWAEDFQEFLSIHLDLPAGADTLSNQPWAKVVYPKYQGLFVRPHDRNDPTGQAEAAVGRWGVVPYFHKGPASTWKFPTNNARSEEMATKASFRDAVKSKRCIIPASSITEWTGKTPKTKHAITRASGAPLFPAGLWASHEWQGERTESYTMVMQDTAPGDDMHVFHNRQPVFLDRLGAATWLDLTADYTPLLKGSPAGWLVADPPEPVST